MKAGSLKHLAKRSGRLFIRLEETHDWELRQRVLVVDGSFIMPHSFTLIARGARERFPNARLSVLTFKDRESLIRENIPDAEVIVARPRGALDHYRLGLAFCAALRRRFDVVVISSLDVSIVLVALFLSRCPVFLHNRWLEWYHLRQRTVADVFRRLASLDRKQQRHSRSLRQTLKSAARLFVILRNADEARVGTRCLVVDNGYTDISHVSTAVRKALADLLNPEMTVLTFAARKHYYTGMFPQARVILVDSPDGIALSMWGLRHERFSHVVLTTLDASPVFAAFLCFGRRVLLYNQWHQWWVLSPRGIGGLLRQTAAVIMEIPLFIYLLVVSTFVLCRMRVRAALATAKI